VEYFPALKENFSQADTWTALVTAEQWGRFHGLCPGHLSLVADPPAGTDPCYAKVNAWLDGHRNSIYDDDYYQFLCDDDALPAALVPRLKTFSDEILVLSCKRGDQVPPEAPFHPNWPLLASPENMRTCFCTWEQAVMKGRVLKALRFQDTSSCADGAMMEWLKANYSEKIRYLPDLFVKFNYLQPGRWHR
jgi:hypothetical protein